MAKKTLFYLQSFLSGAVEIGVLFYAFKLGMQIHEIVLLGVAYQAGNLIRNFQLKKALILLDLFILPLLLLSKCDIFILILLTFSISWNLQLTRDVVKAQASTLLKRLCRILGFAVVPLINYEILKFIFLFSMCVYFLKYNEVKCHTIDNTTISKSDYIMVFHQLHYFSYCYIMLFLICNINTLYSLSVIIFVSGWISYTFTQKILRNSLKLQYAVIAHCLLAITLLIIAFNTENYSLLTSLWILTGFFGGTVYILKSYLKNLKRIKSSHIDYIEDVGHFIGASLSFIIICISNDPKYPIIMASIFAFLTAILLRKGASRA